MDLKIQYIIYYKERNKNMVEFINRLLSVDDFFNTTERINIAKGKYELTSDVKRIWKQKKRYK